MELTTLSPDMERKRSAIVIALTDEYGTARWNHMTAQERWDRIVPHFTDEELAVIIPSIGIPSVQKYVEGLRQERLGRWWT